LNRSARPYLGEPTRPDGRTNRRDTYQRHDPSKREAQQHESNINGSTIPRENSPAVREETPPKNPIQRNPAGNEREDPPPEIAATEERAAPKDPVQRNPPTARERRDATRNLHHRGKSPEKATASGRPVKPQG
jgi:hypothetical protein